MPKKNNSRDLLPFELEAQETAINERIRKMKIRKNDSGLHSPVCKAIQGTLHKGAFSCAPNNSMVPGTG